METVELVIKMPKDVYEDYWHLGSYELRKIISNGILLPKGHGELIDKQEISDYVKSYIHEIISESGRDLNEHTNRVLRSIIEHLYEAETVIEADKEGAENEH